MIKYVSRGESYSTWKFHQRDADRHRGHLTETEDARRIGYDRTRFRRLWSPSFVVDNFRPPSEESKDIIPLAASRRQRNVSRWAGNMESLQSKFESVHERREDNSILSFNPISASPEYPNTFVVDVPHGVLFTQSSSLSLFLPLCHSASLFLRFLILSFAQHLRSTVHRRKSVFPIYGNILSRGTVQWSSHSVRNFDLSPPVSRVWSHARALSRYSRIPRRIARNLYINSVVLPWELAISTLEWLPFNIEFGK